MSIYTRMRRQTCVYWPVDYVDDAGMPVHGMPQELAPPNGVRWDDVQEVFVSETGEQVVSKAKVYVPFPVDFNGVLWKGKLTDLPDWDNPLENQGAYLIRSYNEIPNLRNTKVLRYAIL